MRNEAYDVKEAIRNRARREPQYRRSLLCDALTALVAGEVETMKMMLRTYINATLGFSGLERRTHIPSKSLVRMLSANGNPTLRNFVTILTALQKNEDVHFERIGR